MVSLQKVVIPCDDQRVKDLCYGYSKQMEKLFKLSSIPKEIVDIFLMYYYFPEFFDKARKDRFTISADKMTIENIEFSTDHEHTIFMKQWIDSLSNKLIKWRFRINKFRGNYMYFGLSSGYDQNSINRDFSVHQNPAYMWTNYAMAFFNNEQKWTTEYNCRWGAGSNVLLSLDLPKATLFCQVDDGDESVVFEKIERRQDLKYILVLQMHYQSVTLLDFEVFESK